MLFSNDLSRWNLLTFRIMWLLEIQSMSRVSIAQISLTLAAGVEHVTHVHTLCFRKTKKKKSTQCYRPYWNKEHRKMAPSAVLCIFLNSALTVHTTVRIPRTVNVITVLLPQCAQYSTINYTNSNNYHYFR